MFAGVWMDWLVPPGAGKGPLQAVPEPPRQTKGGKYARSTDRGARRPSVQGGPPPGRAPARRPCARPEPAAPAGARRRLDRIIYFDMLETVKSIAPLPLARLEANEGHVEAFKALAHLTRLQVFFFLVRAGREMSVGEIQGAVGVPGPTLSHHLDLLRRAGLVESRREERYIYYSVQREAVTTLVRLLTACC